MSDSNDPQTMVTIPDSAVPVKKPNHNCLVKEMIEGGSAKKLKGGKKFEVDCEETDKDKLNNSNGGADIKSKYKKTLNKKTLEDLRKMAKGKGIKITTKKDGKSVYLKKSSIINKLCNFKHPKKTVKKTTKRK